MEVRQAVLALDFVDPEFDLAECVLLIGLEIGERYFEDTTLQSIVGVLETGRSIVKGFADSVILLEERSISWRNLYRTLGR